MTTDLAARWTEHLDEFMAEWYVPEDLRAAPGAPGQAPWLVLKTNDAIFYTVWLEMHGYITPAEQRGLLADIERAQ